MQEIRVQANDAYSLFSTNPEHPSLRFKKVHAIKPIYSARVTLDCRVDGVVDGDSIAWFWIGKHADYEKLLASF